MVALRVAKDYFEEWALFSLVKGREVIV